ncbi:MAG: 3-keto-disaccharide hydrolase, partial [Cyclobacteriaceae bacterium]
VHSIRDPEMAGTIVKWRNIRIKTEDLEGSRMPGDDIMEISYLTNQLTGRQEKEGWKFLWDGKTTEGWRGAKLDAFPDKGWEMKDGVLTVLSSGGAEARHGGDIITKDTYSNFELEVDFMITEGANSGIKYFVDPELNKGEGSAIGLEFQLLDDKKHPDASQGVAGNRTLASLYDLISCENLSEPGRKDIRFTGVGKWNRARIVSKDNHVEHWLNNIKVVSYERGTQMYRALVAYSKYKVWPNFGEADAGHILLQDHGDTVHFKNIKIKEL